MTADIVVLAEYRERRARVQCSVTFDPLQAWRAWAAFWWGR